MSSHCDEKTAFWELLPGDTSLTWTGRAVMWTVIAVRAGANVEHILLVWDWELGRLRWGYAGTLDYQRERRPTWRLLPPPP